MGRGSQRSKIGIIAATVSILGTVSGVAQTLDVAPTATVAPATRPAGLPPSATGSPNSSLTANIGLTTRVELDSNPDLSTGPSESRFRVSEDLSFSVLSESRTQIFEVSATTGLRFSNTHGSGSETETVDPRIQLRYFRESANSDLDIRGSYREGDVSSSFDEDPSAAVSLIVDTGTLQATTASLDFSIGKEAPLGLDAGIAFDRVEYSGTTDPGLIDEEKITASLALNAEISGTTQARLSFTNIDYDSTDPASLHTETNVYNATLSHELGRGLTIDGSLGFREKDTYAGGPITTRDGMFGSLDVTQSRSNGAVFAGMSFDNSRIEDHASLTFGRSLDLPDGSLSARVTLTDVSGTGTQLFGNLNYFKELRSGSLRIDLDRTLETNDQDEDIAFTQLGVNLLHEVTEISNVNLSMSVSRSEDGGAGAAETLDRASFTATYSRPLTSDWDWSVGYRHRRSSSSTSSLATSDAIFMTLSRNIQFGF
ncbi:MAG: hypothetical protein KUG69_06960 [Marinosulfonomonas sp.]|nr:hypothetical protein [Marinosulfonomonas sp.]